MKPLFRASLFVALLSAMPLPAQDSRSEESSPSSLPASTQTREKEPHPSALRRKLPGVREQQHSDREHNDHVEARPEERIPFFELQPGTTEKRAGLSPGFAGARTLAQNAFGNAQEAWVRHYGGGLAPSHEEATAIAVDAAGNVYVTGHGSGLPLGMDYLTVKYNSTGAEVWKARYDGPDHGDDFALAIAVDGAGNVYVTGYSFSVSGYYDYATVKYNSAGVQQWVQRYEGPENNAEVAYDIAVDADGNVYVTGYSYVSGSYYDYLTIKYDSAGAQQWLQSYDGGSGSTDYATALKVDASGNVYVTGRSYSSGSSYDYATLKYNSAGTQQWVQRYNGAGNGYDYALALAVDVTGNVYVTGYSVGAGTSQDYATIKYNNSGVEQWVQRYNGPGNSYDVALAIAVDAAGNVYVTGYTYSSGSSYDYATIKYNSGGAQQWVQGYNGPGNGSDYALDIGTDATGNVYVAGYSYGSGTSYDYAIIKYNGAGAEQWVQRYNGPVSSYDYLYAFRLDATGNLYVTGYSYGGSSSGDDYATVKYNSAGVKQWEARYNGPGGADGVATALACDAAGNVYVTGYSRAASTGYDYATIKYDSAGAEQWVRRYNSAGSSSDYAYAVAVDGAGNVYVAGSSGTVKYNSAGVQQWAVAGSAVAIAVDGAGNVYVTGTLFRSGSLYDYRTAKYNSAGVTQWTNYYNGPANNYDYAVALALDASSNVYVTGYGKGGASDYDYVTIKYNSAGAEQWVQRYNHAPADSADYALALAVTPASGEVYVTGSSYGGSTSFDYATIKYNSAGVEQWVQRATTLGAYRDESYDVAVDATGNVYVAGTSGVIKYNNTGTQQWVNSDYAINLALDVAGNVYVTSQTYGSSYDYVTTKYNGAGTMEWSKTYSGPGTDEPTALCVDPAGNVYVTGWSYGHSWADYTTVKYTQDTPPPRVTVLKPQASSLQLTGAEFGVDIVIDSVQSLFGASFDLSYTNTAFIDVVTPHSSNVIPGSFLGNDVVFFYNVDETVGKVSIGISRKAGQSGVSGSGVLARVKFKSLENTPVNTQVVFSFSNATANDPSGKAIPLTPVTLAVTIGGVVVWPGDTNNDGKVDAADVLPIGLYWNKTGSARQNGSCNWAGQPATPWTPAQATYADANGDGKVDAADVLCIGLNWGKTHSVTALTAGKTSSAKMLNKSNAGTLCHTITGDTTAGGEFWVNIHAMNVMALFGFSFELLYSPTVYLDPQMTEAGSFMGNDVIFFPNVDKTTGKISIGISQKAPQSGVSGSGVVARIKMKMSASAPAGQAVNLTLQNVVANDSSGGSIEMAPTGQCIITGVEEFTQTGSAPTAFVLHAPSPNPFNPSTTLKYDLPQQVEVKLVIFDMLGRRVRTLVDQTQQAGRYAVIWDGRNEHGQPVASGTFLYQLRAGNPSAGPRRAQSSRSGQGFVQTRRMALVR